MITHNKSIRLSPCVLSDEMLGCSLLDILVDGNVGKIYTVYNKYANQKHIILVASMGRGCVVPLGMDGRVFGGADATFWDRWQVTEGWSSFLTLTRDLNAL